MYFSLIPPHVWCCKFSYALVFFDKVIVVIKSPVGSKSKATPVRSSSMTVVAHWESNSWKVYLSKPLAGSATKTWLFEILLITTKWFWPQWTMQGSSASFFVFLDLLLHLVFWNQLSRPLELCPAYLRHLYISLPPHVFLEPIGQAGSI